MLSPRSTTSSAGTSIDDAAIGLALSPAADPVGLAQGGDEPRPAAFHRQPVEWQRSSGTSSEMNGGRQRGMKLYSRLVLHRQENRVFTSHG